MYSPSDLQREILELNFNDFVTKTNIKDIVLKEYRRNRNDENLVLSPVAMYPRLEYFYDFRKRTWEWHANLMKNLKFKHDVEVVDNSSAKTASKASSSHLPERQMSQFERDIMALTPEAFIDETNIIEIVVAEYKRQHPGKEISEVGMSTGLNYFESIRYKPSKWNRTALVDLKFKICDCKRNRQFDEKSVATDEVERCDIETQCSMTDVGANNPVSGHDRQSNNTAIEQSQLTCNANLTADASGSHSEQNENDAEEYRGK